MSVNHGANIFELCDIYGVKHDELMDFSSNINPFGSSDKAKKQVIDNIDMVSLYPDPEYKKLKSSISSYCDAKVEHILLGSGATELISEFTKTINPKKALLLAPSYSEYEKELNKIGCATDLYLAKKENDFKINVSSFIEYINSKDYDLVIICNPNNPTGFAFTNSELSEILTKTNSFIMVDETYIEFTDMKTYACTNLCEKFDKLFVIRGTSKFFSVPGIRLGYGILSNKEIFDKMNSSLDLWNINIFATLMGEVMFLDSEYIDSSYKKISTQRKYLLENLNAIKSIKVYDTASNFILCELKNQTMTARNLYENLIKDKIIIRDCKSFYGLSEYFFRVCILTENENKILLKSLNNILK